MLENPSDFLPASECSADAEVAVLNTSFMYQTAPMYVTDQPKFINCACIVCSLRFPILYSPPTDHFLHVD